MKNTESGLFFLFSIFFYIKGFQAKAEKTPRKENRFYMLTLIFAALAMASKSSTVILPLVLGLTAWWVEGGWHWRNLVKITPIFLMSIAAGAVSIWTQGQYLAAIANTAWERPWPERLAAAGDAVWFYLGKLLWPHPLVMVYPRWQIDARQGISYLPLLAVIIVLFILWRKRESWAPWFFAYSYFLIALLPGLGLIDNCIFTHSLVFDHFQYLASMGPLALAGAGITRAADFLQMKWRWLPRTFSAGVLLILALLSWQRIRVYQNQETLWRDTLAHNPNFDIGHNNLGIALREKGQLNQAIAEYERALEINPLYAEARYNLGIALSHVGRLDEAIDQYRQALESDPNDALIHNNLANLLFQKGRLDEAIAEYQKALEIRPAYAGAHNNLGMVFLRQGGIKQAIVQFQEALQLEPGLAIARESLARAQAMVRQGSAKD